MRSLFKLLFVLFSIVLNSCNPNNNRTDKPIELPEGIWRGVLELPKADVPFNFNVGKDPDRQPYLELMNGKERLRIEEVTIQGDSVFIPMHIFDADIRARFTNNQLVGTYRKYDAATPYEIPFTATHGVEYRFAPGQQAPKALLTGKWAVTFVEGEKVIEAVGIFDQNNHHLTGTFLTKSGDYRFLEGVVYGDSMMLSTFDGSHIYLFTARINDVGNLEDGKYYSGLTGFKTWTAKLDENASLPDANSLTYLKEGYEQINFTFPNLQGERVSLSDPKYQNKVVLVQIFGTWCPNCMDETAFLAKWYAENKHRGVEIIALAFEKKADPLYAKSRIEKVIKRYNAQYDFLFAGTTDQENRDQALPMLNKVISFPTTIFIDRQGRVRRIHTGFSGPGTGKYYTEFVEEFNKTMDQLLAEPVPQEVLPK